MLSWEARKNAIIKPVFHECPLGETRSIVRGRLVSGMLSMASPPSGPIFHVWFSMPFYCFFFFFSPSGVLLGV